MSELDPFQSKGYRMTQAGEDTNLGRPPWAVSSPLTSSMEKRQLVVFGSDTTGLKFTLFEFYILF